MHKNTIATMSLSAAKLLLAYLVSKENATEEEVIACAGIGTFPTYRKALKELEDAGFIQELNGTRHIILRKVE